MGNPVLPGQDVVREQAQIFQHHLFIPYLLLVLGDIGLDFLPVHYFTLS